MAILTAKELSALSRIPMKGFVDGKPASASVMQTAVERTLEQFETPVKQPVVKAEGLHA